MQSEFAFLIFIISYNFRASSLLDHLRTLRTATLHSLYTNFSVQHSIPVCCQVEINELRQHLPVDQDRRYWAGEPCTAPSPHIHTHTQLFLRSKKKKKKRKQRKKRKSFKAGTIKILSPRSRHYFSVFQSPSALRFILPAALQMQPFTVIF